MPTDPMNIEVRKRLHEGGLGDLQMVFSVGNSGGGGFSDPPLGKSLESRLTGLIWVNDDAMGCGYIGNFDIHAIDAVIWALGRRPVSAYGRGGSLPQRLRTAIPWTPISSPTPSPTA